MKKRKDMKGRGLDEMYGMGEVKKMTKMKNMK